jgi:hypothetical protein
MALIVYGIVGIVLFAGVAIGINRPLDRLQRVSASVEEQRTAAVSALDQAETTIEDMSEGVGRLDTSLAEVDAAIDRASQIATGVASSMFQLRDSSNIEIFGQQPFAGLSASFDVAGTNLTLLSEDLAGIGAALDANRGDVVLTSENLSELADSVGELSDAVSEGPSVDVSAASIDMVRLAIFAVCGWLVVFAIGCVLLGGYIVKESRG